MKMRAEQTELTALTQKIYANPHFAILPDIIRASGIAEDIFFRDFEVLLSQLLAEHKDDNEALRSESHYYILPAIAVYKTMKTYMSDPLAAFREMWHNGAEYGAKVLRKKAEDEAFLASWCQSVTPKNENAGAFVFRIISTSDTHTEYHVLSCPYVRLCEDYECREIVRVFCDSDDISFGHIHPRLTFGRTKTIGRGDPVCDFSYTYLAEEEK